MKLDGKHQCDNFSKLNIKQFSTEMLCPTIEKLENGYTLSIGQQIIHKCKPGYKLFDSKNKGIFPLECEVVANAPVCIKISKLQIQ